MRMKIANKESRKYLRSKVSMKEPGLYRARLGEIEERNPSLVGRGNDTSFPVETLAWKDDISFHLQSTIYATSDNPCPPRVSQGEHRIQTSNRMIHFDSLIAIWRWLCSCFSHTSRKIDARHLKCRFRWRHAQMENYQSCQWMVMSILHACSKRLSGQAMWRFSASQPW